MLFVNEKSKLSTKLILEKTREIIARAFHELNDEELMAMPSCSTAQRMLQRKREHPEAAQINAKEVHNIVIEGDYANDEEGHQFLLYDSRNHAPDDAVFFIFATQMGIIRLRTYRHWSGDGTFEITPSNFLQLYTLNVLVEQSSVPSAYILMCNKAADTYRRVFEVLREHIEVGPLSIMMDFEQGARNGFQQIWPNIVFRMCLFQLGQSVLRRVQVLHLNFP